MQDQRVRLYDTSNIDTLPWPDNDDGSYAKRFLIPFIKNGPGYYIDNVETKMMVLLIDDLVFPITINGNDIEHDNSHVCSTTSHYVSSAFEKISLIENRLLQCLLKGTLVLLKKICEWGNINKVIAVNNWLFSTNLYPKITSDQIKAIKTALRYQFPQHAIVFKSIHTYTKESPFDALKENRFEFIASRQVYFTDTQEEKTFRSRMFKSDLKLLAETDYEVVENHHCSPEEISRITRLYQALYIDKYSKLSPQLNAKFMELVVKNKILNLKILKRKGQVDAVVGYFSRNGMMTSPLFGYDTSQPQNHGLYRLISTLLAIEARNQKALLNHSAGASSYKKLRRAEPHVEYMGIYCNHLPLRRKIPWKILRTIINRIGIPIMQKYEL